MNVYGAYITYGLDKEKRESALDAEIISLEESQTKSVMEVLEYSEFVMVHIGDNKRVAKVHFEFVEMLNIYAKFVDSNDNTMRFYLYSVKVLFMEIFVLRILSSLVKERPILSILILLVKTKRTCIFIR